jgi:hypothetical protein
MCCSTGHLFSPFFKLELTVFVNHLAGNATTQMFKFFEIRIRLQSGVITVMYRLLFSAWVGAIADFKLLRPAALSSNALEN